MERVGLLTASPYQPSDTQHTPSTPEVPSPYSCARSWQSWSSRVNHDFGAGPVDGEELE